MSQFPKIDKSAFKIVYHAYKCPWGGQEDIYDIPLKLLHLNKDNGRIATFVSGYESKSSLARFENMDSETWNKTLINFIKQSSSKEDHDRTRKSIQREGQLQPGAILSDGTVVAGNRRCSILMELLEETGDYDKYGYFRCAIFELPDTEEGRRQIKRLETKTQYGEDSPVAYGPIEKLVDIYTNVLEKGHPYSASEYQNFLGIKKSAMDNYVTRANILVEYLEFIGKPKNYEVARIDKLDGPINELAGLYRKVNEREWNRIKPAFFQTLKDCRGDRTRIIRAQIKTYNGDRNTFEEDLKKQDEALLREDAARHGVQNGQPQTPINPKSREDLFLRSAYGLSKEAARNKPIAYIDEATSAISKVDFSIVNAMTEKEKEEFYSKVDLLISKLECFPRK